MSPPCNPFLTVPVALVASLTLTALPAAAQVVVGEATSVSESPAETVPPGRVHVQIEAPSMARVYLLPGRHVAMDPAIEASQGCTTPCTLLAQPGQRSLVVRDSDAPARRYQLRILPGDMRVRLREPPTRGARGLASAGAILGAVSGAFGVLFALDATVFEHCTTTTYSSSGGFLGGLGASTTRTCTVGGRPEEFALGVTMATLGIGLNVFALWNIVRIRHGYDVFAPAVSLSLQPTPSGAFGALTTRF